MQQYHNVSVRLTSDEYKDLQFLSDRFNQGLRIGKVTQAEIIRHALNELKIQELNLMQKEEDETAAKVKELLKAEKQKEKQNQKKSVPTESAEIESALLPEIESALQEYESELRNSTNSKGKAYSESYIKQALKKREKELIEGTAEKEIATGSEEEEGTDGE